MGEGVLEFYRIRKDRINLRIKVIPRAGVNRLVGVRNGELTVKLKVVPERGKANRELIRMLASLLGVPTSEIEIRSGAASPHKVLSVAIECLPALQKLM